MLDQICQLARDAGDAIMQVYDGAKPMDVVSKADDSPVTAADIAAHTVILKGLQTLTPDIPVLSEEAPQDWLVAEVLSGGGRAGAVVPPFGADERLGYGGRACGGCGRRRACA